MHSPPSSSDMFLSSPIHCTGSDPEEEVQILLATAQKVTTLDRNLSAVVNHHREVFLGTFSRQVQLLKSRSQALEDAHITVYDKVLLFLTDNGNQLETPAAITWYCKEHLGFNLSDISDCDGQTKIERSLTAISDLSQAISPAVTQQEIRPGAISFSRVADSSELRSKNSGDDPKFQHLWSVYKEAHADYLTLADKHNDNALEAAKFLRDTAENGIHFLEQQYPSDPKLLELTKTYNMAKSVAVALNGGKKRKFDRAMGQDRKQYQAKKHLSLIAEHNRVNTARRHREKNVEKAKPHGRGPSGIPYGYTRPVDSYYPA